MLKYCILPFIFFILRLQSRSLYFKTKLDSCPTSFYKCYKQSGFNDVAVFMSPDLDDDLSDVFNARNAGLQVEVVLPPTCSDIENYVSGVLKIFSTNTIRRFWFYPLIFMQGSKLEGELGKSTVGLSPEQKCQCLDDLIKNFEKRNLRAGITTHQNLWKKNFGQGCLQGSKSLLWWIPGEQELDDEPNFDNFVKFGGWEKPYMKLLDGMDYICGVPFEPNFYEGE